MRSPWNRRRFLGAAAKIPVAAGLAGTMWSCSDEPGKTTATALLSEHEAATLHRYCYLLFPYPDVGPAPYSGIVSAVAGTVEGDPDTAVLIRDGLATLDDDQQLAWLELDESSQLAALERTESGPFFQYMLDKSKSILFNDRTIWAHIGYDPGVPSNDIDWLGDE